MFCGHVHSFIPNFRYHNSGEIVFNGDELDTEKLDCSPFIDEGIVNLDSYTRMTHNVNVYTLEV